MIGSLFAGISGLNANSTAMTVIGDNIANVNTTAFKSNRASFANVLSQAIGGGGNDIGRSHFSLQHDSGQVSVLFCDDVELSHEKTILKDN